MLLSPKAFNQRTFLVMVAKSDFKLTITFYVDLICFEIFIPGQVV